MSQIKSVFGCKSNLSDLPESNTIRPEDWTPTIPNGQTHTSGITSTLQVSWSAQQNSKEGWLDYTIEPDFCRSTLTQTGTQEELPGVSVQRQQLLNQLNPDTFATFSRRCASKFVEDIPSYINPFTQKGAPKAAKRLAKDRHEFENGMKTLTMDFCTILYINMIKANKANKANKTKTADSRIPPGVVYVEPLAWPERTAAGVDQVEAILASNHPRPVTTRSSKPLQNAMNGTTPTSDKSANFRVFWRQQDGSRMLIATPKKPLQLQSKQTEEGSGTANIVDDGDGTRLPPEPPAFVRPDPRDDISDAAWAYLHGGGGFN
jgi:hypothetical protein